MYMTTRVKIESQHPLPLILVRHVLWMASGSRSIVVGYSQKEDWTKDEQYIMSWVWVRLDFLDVGNQVLNSWLNNAFFHSFPL